MAYRLLISIEVIEFIERLLVKTREAIRACSCEWVNEGSATALRIRRRY
jgi:hypothetical protein